MKFSIIIATIAVFVATVSAGAAKGANIQQGSHDLGNEGRVEGLLNNALKAGILSDNSEVVGTNQHAN
ncbi:uncharacterized protein BYT42DRAFT_618695 [Radiomyces spectabilis]|uniref:uncharacterized protein n=1 Tax=Radiomyces spectabilis TaxID=64574 RepID=UPI00221EE9E5|nr:uncharacterized protein BYT42DRAFT_618695 [Radiomyces spectabilis]KAI8365315.1 hypothetical protein BYT42DRAFT_618695 [Radiomyces spectabilis]